MLGKRAYESAQIRHFECLSSETWYHVQMRPIFQKIHKARQNICGQTTSENGHILTIWP